MPGDELAAAPASAPRPAPSPELLAAAGEILRPGGAPGVTGQADGNAGASRPGGSDRAAPGAPGAATEAERDAAMGVCMMVVEVIGGIVAERFPATAYTTDEKLAVAAVLAPVFIKHGITAAWLEKWREEIAAAVVVGKTAYVGFQRVKAAEAAAKPAADASASAS